jgi:putative ABC transport system permease protein
VGPGEPQNLYEIVGVVGNSKYQSLRDDFEPIVFVAETQNKEAGLGINFIVRSALPIGALTSLVKRDIAGENAGISLQFQVFKTQIRDSLLREQLMATLSGFFGTLAAILATVGLYGVISYMIARRRNEIGIRIALGASRRNVLRLVLQEASLLLLAGLVVGTALAIAVGRTVSSLLYGLKSGDPVTLGLAVVLLASVSLAASLIPALRAARLDPMSALREE